MAQNNNSKDLLEALLGVSSNPGKNAIQNHALTAMEKNTFVTHLAGALGVEKSRISFNTSTGIVSIKDGNQTYQINLAGQNTKSSTYAAYQGEKIINRTVALRDEQGKLGITDLVNGTRRVALDMLKNDPRIKDMKSIADKVAEINKAVVGLQKDYRKIEDRWDIATEKAERRARPSGNILKDTERASTVNYIHQLEKDLAYMGQYWNTVTAQKKNNESWKHFNDRVSGADGVAQGIIGELLNGTSKANVKKMFPEFGKVIDEIYKDYSFLSGTASAANRKRAVLAPINEMVSHNIGTKKEHQTSNVATPWYTKKNTGLFKNITGIATQKASEIARMNGVSLAPGHVRIARVVTNQQIQNAGGRVTDSIRDAHMIMSKMAAQEMQFITRDIKKQLSIDDIMKAKGNKGFNNWNDPAAVRKAITNALKEDKDFLREMHAMSATEKRKFYESMNITAQGFGDNPVTFDVRGNYKVNHFKTGSGKMVNVGGTGRSTAIVSDNDKMFQAFSQDGIPVSMLVGEYLEGAKFTSDIIQDQIYKMLYFGNANGKNLQEYDGAALTKLLNGELQTNPNFKVLKDMGFQFKIDNDGNFIYNMSTQDIEQGAEKLYEQALKQKTGKSAATFAKNRATHIQNYQDQILKTFYGFLGRFNSNLQVVDDDVKKGTWHLTDAKRDYQFVQYNPADVGAPSHGNASSGGFEGQRNTVANAGKFGKNFQAGIQRQFNSKGGGLEARRQAFAQTQKMLKNNAQLSAGTHGTEISVNDLLKGFDPNNIPKKQYVGDKLLASSFDQTTMGIILSKVAKGELDLSHGGFINTRWIDENGNQRVGIPIEPISKAEAQKVLNSQYEMTDTQGNKFKVYDSQAIDAKYDIFNEAFSLSHLSRGGANSSFDDQRNLGDKVLQYGEDRAMSLYDNDGSEATAFGKSDTFNSMRGVAHAVNSVNDMYTANTIWLSKSSLKRMLSRREGANADAGHGLSDAEAQAILTSWNQTHANNQLDYNAWKQQHAKRRNNYIQDFLYDTIINDEKNGVYSDLLVGALNRDPTIGEDATKWARIRYSGAYTGKDIGVSDDLAWLVSGDFDGDTVRAALLSLGLDTSDATAIAKRYEEARTAQATQTTWGTVVSNWLKTKEEQPGDLFTSEDARFSNNPELKQLNRDYTTFAQKSIGNFGNRQFNALKLFSSEGTNLINTNPADAQLFLAMTEQFYQEAISGKKLLEQAQKAGPEKQAEIFAQGRARLTKLNELLHNADLYKTEEGRNQILTTFQELVGAEDTSDFFVNKKLRTQVLGRILSTQAGREALYNSFDAQGKAEFDKIGFLSDTFDLNKLNSQTSLVAGNPNATFMDFLDDSKFFKKERMSQAFGSVIDTLISQGRLEDLVYNNELDTNYRAKAKAADITPEFKELSDSNKQLIAAINKLTNAIEGKSGGGAGGGGSSFSPWEAAQRLKLGTDVFTTSVSKLTAGVNPWEGQDDTQFLHNLLTNKGAFYGYGSAAKLKQAAGARPFAGKLGNISGSMVELMALLGVNTWEDALKKAGTNGSKLTAEQLMYYNDAIRGQAELQAVADAYYGKSGINEQGYTFADYFKKNVTGVAESQRKQLQSYFKESGVELLGGVYPEAMVAGMLGDTTFTSRTDVGFKTRYTGRDAEGNDILREGLVFGDLKNKANGPLGLSDAMQAILTNQAMRTTLQALRSGKEDTAQGLVDTYNKQMQQLGFKTNYKLEDLKKMFTNSAGDYIEEQDLRNIVLKGQSIYELANNRLAQEKALGLILRGLNNGEDVLSKDDKDYILKLLQPATDIGTVGAANAPGGKGTGGAGGHGGSGGGGVAGEIATFAQYKQAAAEYVKYVQQIARIEASMNKMSPEQRQLYQGYLGDLYSQRDAAHGKLKPLYDSLSDKDVKLAAEYNKQMDLTLKKVFTEQQAGALNQKKSIFAQLADGIKMSMQRMFSFGMIGMKLVGKISQSFQKIIGYAQQLDQVMVNIQIVTGKTREEAFSLMGTYNQLAKQLGSTTTEVANSANVWFNESRDHNKPL